MTAQTGPIYEVTFFIDTDIVGDYDRWLEEHIREALRAPGVVQCNTYARSEDEEGHARRVCLYTLANDDALDEFLEGAGGDIDNEVESRFEGRVLVEARILRQDARQEVSGGSPDCLNCGTYMRGQYCAVCGQRSRSRLISLWELVSDAFGDLFELDSRLWKTVVPLLIRPGRLTHDYLQGRRARYMPPFRMYLVLSLLFFVVAFFDPREDLGLLFEPTPEVNNEQAISEAEGRKEEIREKLDELAEQGIIETEEIPEDLDELEGGIHFQVGNDDDGICDYTLEDTADFPPWIQRRMTPERMNHICERMKVGPDQFVDNMLDNVPAALIVLLPLMAFVLKVLYPLSRRYYVEHLLFFVHFHAFFFLILSLQILWVRLSTVLGIPEAIAILMVVIGGFYVPVYLFMAMRRVYGQGRIITFIKYIALVIAYAMGFLATMLGAALIAAMSV